jgi:enolase
VTLIDRVHGRRVWDSRGRPTVEAEVVLQGGIVGRAIAPAGASRGSGEAVDLRDGGTRFGGLDVLRTLDGINGTIAALLRGRDARDQAGVDAALIAADGTRDKSRLGGNALTAVSIATAQAAAAARGVPLWHHLAGETPVALPLPQIQIFGGGAHAAGRLDVQDLMVIPVGAWTYGDALAIVADVYRAAGELLAEEGKLAGVADEGGYWPRFRSNDEALATLVRAIERAGYRPGSDAAIAIDCAASQFGSRGGYRLALDERTLDADALAEVWLDWLARYPIASIEDPFAEDDSAAWERFARAAAHRVQIVGDDLLVTDADRIALAAAGRFCNAVLLKPNQAGTLTETRAALDVARRAGMGTIVSARSGETEDVAVAHLAVGWNAGQIKVGAFARGERMAKWNELLRIEEALGSGARFAGAAALPVARPSAG